MKKSLIAVLAVLALFLGVITTTGCKNTNPAEPATPTLTPTITNTPQPGFSWSTANPNAFGTLKAHCAVVDYSGTLWVTGGNNATNYSANTYSSTDGVTWTLRTSSAAFGQRTKHTAVVYNDGGGNKMYVIGGYAGGSYFKDVYSSTNGIDWAAVTKNAAFGGVQGHASVVFNSKMWVIGGAFAGASVYSSSNGADWTAETLNAECGGRVGHTALVYNGKIWVIGGQSSGYMQDVWSSTDGVVWTQVTAAAAFGPRMNHVSFVLDNRMWVIGGNDGTQVKKDAWYSTDGVTWTLATSSVGATARWRAAGYVLGTKGFILGGTNFDDTVYYGDVVRSN